MEPNYENDMRADDLFLESDAREHLDAVMWIENEDGSGFWSDHWESNADLLEDADCPF